MVARGVYDDGGGDDRWIFEQEVQNDGGGAQFVRFLMCNFLD